MKEAENPPVQRRIERQRQEGVIPPGDALLSYAVHVAHQYIGETNLSNRRMRTRLYGGVARVGG
jgi:hypothetical protein